MQRDAALRDEGKERVRRVVEDGISKKPTRGGDECRRRAVSPFGTNKFIGENSGRRSYINRRIRVDVNVVKIFICFLKETVPKRGEMEVRVGEEEKSDL